MKVAQAAGQLSAYKDTVRTVVVDMMKQEQVQKLDTSSLHHP
jgi:hypothetical protein